MRMILSQTVLKLFQQETVYQRCFWKNPLLAEAQLSDLPEKQRSLDLPELDEPPGETAKRHHPSYSLVHRVINMCHKQAFMVARLAAENGLERSLSTMLPFPVHLQLSLLAHTTVSQGCLRHLHS